MAVISTDMIAVESSEVAVASKCEGNDVSLLMLTLRTCNATVQLRFDAVDQRDEFYKRLVEQMGR